MKKTAIIGLMFVLVFSFIQIPVGQVEAAPAMVVDEIPTTPATPPTPEPTETPTPKPAVEAGPAAGSWEWTASTVTGEIIPMNKIGTPPHEWTRLLSNPLRVDGRTQICHPFGGGQNGWHTSIYLLNGKTWLELPTTVEWVPDEEGKLMACTYAPVSGVYAMFGYWEWFEGFKTAEPTQEPTQEPTLPPQPV